MKKQNMKKTNKGRELKVILAIFLAAFLLMIVYLCWFLLAESESFVNNPYNKRIDALAEKTVRGSILAEDGTVLAYTEPLEGGEDLRVYPFRSEYAHAVGYLGYGKLGLENTANFYLLRSHDATGKRLRHAFTGEKNMGDSLVTTLNPALQDAAYRALSDYKGAVIAMESETGKVLAVVSKPDFDPNTIAETYEALSQDNESASLLNRATQGRYAPGSTFKILTTLAYMHEHPTDYPAYTFDCTGSFLSDGKEIHCYHDKAHGEEDLLASFTNSCNSSYASLSLSLDADRFTKLCNQALFNQRIAFDLPTEASRFALEEDASDAVRMETAIGQGKTLATPLQMALLVSAIDNGGKVPKPYLMKETVSADGKTVESFVPKDSRGYTLMSEEDALVMQGYLRSVITDGTGSGLLTDRYEAYGKTGTAEYNSAGDSHSWFVGYARQEGKPDLVVAVILEGAGAGSSYAVPAAKMVFDTYFQ